MSTYRVQLHQAVPGTNTRWRKLADEIFETEDTPENVTSAVKELPDEFAVTEVEVEIANERGQ